MAYATGMLTGGIVSTHALQPAKCKRTLRSRTAKSPVAKAIAQEQTPQQAGTKEAENQLEALKAISLVVADTGEYQSALASALTSIDHAVDEDEVDEILTDTLIDPDTSAA